MQPGISIYTGAKVRGQKVRRNLNLEHLVGRSRIWSIWWVGLRGTEIEFKVTGGRSSQSANCTQRLHNRTALGAYTTALSDMRVSDTTHTEWDNARCM